MQFKELPEKVTLLIARLSYNGYERVEIANWLVQTALALHDHPRIANVFHAVEQGYPTPLVRNRILKFARERGINFVCMTDDDMCPDVHSPGRASGYPHLPTMRDQQNFFPSAIDYALEHPGPCVIAAPYCAGPPEERVLVSRFREKQSDCPNAMVGGMELTCFTREEAAERTGFEMVSSLPTGLILIDMRTLDAMGAPWFDYEYADHWQTKLASTEDTVFSRNALYLGIPQICAWSSWAAHLKTKAVGRPRKFPTAAFPAQITQFLREQIAREQQDARPAPKANPLAMSFLSLANDESEDEQVIPLGEEKPSASDPNGDGSLPLTELRMKIEWQRHSGFGNYGTVVRGNLPDGKGAIVTIPLGIPDDQIDDVTRPILIAAFARGDWFQPQHGSEVTVELKPNGEFKDKYKREPIIVT